MTDPVIIDAGVVGFNREDRIVTGMLLPYGEECRSSVGRFAFDSGVVEIPQDVPGIVGFNIEHKRDEPIGRAVSVTETPQGLLGTFRIAEGAEGDAALADIEAGKRKHLSAEVTKLRIKGGKGIGARLFGAALVAEPAFPSAGLFAAADTDDAAADTEDVLEPQEGEEVLNESTSVDEWTDENGKTWKRTRKFREVRIGNEIKTTEHSVLEEPEPPAEDPEEGTMATATAPVGFSAPASAPAPVGKTEARPITKQAFFSALLEARRTGDYNRPELRQVLETEQRLGLFALADAKYDAAAGDPGKMYQPQYLGEIWEGDDDSTERRIVPLLAHGDLTELEFDDSRWTQKAIVGRWAGNKTEIPSQAPKRSRNAKERAQAFAGGLDIALEYRHFGHEAEIEEFVKQMRDSYAVESDAYVAEKLLAAATPLEYTSRADVREPFVKLVQGMLAVRRVGKARPTFALLADDMYEEYLYTPKDEVLHFLSATAGLDEGTFNEVTIEPWEDLEPGQVLVGARKAATVLELPGAPIRINALDIARGGHDEALFGYVGVRTQRPEALQLVSDPVAP